MFEIICNKCKRTESMDGSDPPTKEDLLQACEQHRWMNLVGPNGSFKSICPDCGIKSLGDLIIEDVPQGTNLGIVSPEPDQSEDWKNA